MTAIDQLTEAEKAQGLAQAYEALSAYGLADADVSWLAYTHNRVFAVAHQTGRYVLRLHLAQAVRRDWLEGEIGWLRAIGADSALVVPRPVSLRDGGFVYADESWVAVLFEHIAGEIAQPDTLSAINMQHIGAFIGQLHNVTITSQQTITRPRLDYDGLFGEAGRYRLGEAAAIFTPKQTAVFDATTARIQQTMDTLGTGSDVFGLIHGDLLAKNILIVGDRVRALDFEYCGYGYYLYDLTPLLWQLKSARADDYGQLEAALWAGYISVRPDAVPHRNLLEPFIAARQVASCRWLAGNLDNPAVKDTAHTLIAQRVAELRGFLDRGVLHRQSMTL